MELFKARSDLLLLRLETGVLLVCTSKQGLQFCEHLNRRDLGCDQQAWKAGERSRIRPRRADAQLLERRALRTTFGVNHFQAGQTGPSLAGKVFRSQRRRN